MRAVWFLLCVALAGPQREKPHPPSRINTATAEPFRVSPPEAVAYPLELGLSRAAIRHRMSRYGITHLRGALRPLSPAAGDQAGALLADGFPLESTREPARVSASNWEQKPVAVLAVEMTWPAVSEGEVSPYEP